jgi:hypothetical protein
MQVLRHRSDIEPRILDKIVDANPRALYGR